MITANHPHWSAVRTGAYHRHLAVPNLDLMRYQGDHVEAALRQVREQLATTLAEKTADGRDYHVHLGARELDPNDTPTDDERAAHCGAPGLDVLRKALGTGAIIRGVLVLTLLKPDEAGVDEFVSTLAHEMQVEAIKHRIARHAYAQDDPRRHAAHDHIRFPDGHEYRRLPLPNPNPFDAAHPERHEAWMRTQ